MTHTKHILILFGGKSVEHEVSVVSARNIVAALDKNKYTVSLVGIDHQGRWIPYTEQQLQASNVVALPEGDVRQAITPFSSDGQLVLGDPAVTPPVDVVFPVLHGAMGEDGTMQGLLTLAGVPYVGANVLGSAVGMDKDVAKRLLHEAGLPIGKYRVFRAHQKQAINYADIEQYLGIPCFVKPANAGSSVGVSKAYDEASFAAAVETAFQYDSKILIEEYTQGREVECAVLGNEDPIVSVPGDIVPSADFYSYEAKYIDENGAVLTIPTQIPEAVQAQVRDIALRVYETLCCEGMARVDCFVTETNEVYVNEINTIPGFTTISMYPKLWEASGVPYAELIDRLVDLAIDRAHKQQQLQTTFEQHL